MLKYFAIGATVTLASIGVKCAYQGMYGLVVLFAAMTLLSLLFAVAFSERNTFNV